MGRSAMTSCCFYSLDTAFSANGDPQTWMGLVFVDMDRTLWHESNTTVGRLRYPSIRLPIQSGRPGDRVSKDE